MDHNLIIISGLGYSGKSAVIDSLYFNDIVTGFANSRPKESSIFHTNSSALNFIRSSEKINIEVLKHLISGGRILTKYQNSIDAGRNQKNNSFDGFLTAKSLEDIIEGNFKKESINKMEYYQLMDIIISRLASLSGKLVCLENDPYINDLDYLRKTSLKPLYLVVIRNPLDIYFDVKVWSNSISLKVKLFSFSMAYNKKILILFKEVILNYFFYKSKYTFRVIRFENFVTYKDSLKNLLSILNYNKSFVFKTKNWDFNNSKSNIGVHKELNKSEVLMLTLLTLPGRLISSFLNYSWK